MKIKFIQAFVVGLCLYSATVGAVPWDNPTDAEVASLPPYCLAKFRGVAVEQWQNTLGSIYLHVHHYCGAMVYINRYYKSSNAQDRKFYIREIIDNLDYMISHAEQSSALMPEIYFTKGRVLTLDGRNGEAAKEFFHAIQLKPDYVDPYAALADFYSGVGKKQDALKILEEGLRQVPGSRSLVRRYHELGGKNPLPSPPPPAASATPVEAKTAGVKTDANAPIQPAVSIPAPASEGATTPVATQPAPAAEDSSKIGSPTNPYCRFCP